jgi:hypothetical protein
VTNSIKVLLMIALCSASAGAAATETDVIAPCAGVTEIKSKSRQLNHIGTMMVTLLILEKQGEAEFRPKYAAPASACLLEKFDVAGTSVNALYTPFEKGEHTLHYRFTAQSGEEAREILVVYDGDASLTYKKGDVFQVVENRKGDISCYEMFRDQPTYGVVKAIFTSIIDGSAKPLVTVRWPPGAKEPVIDAFDTKRLK